MWEATSGPKSIPKHCKNPPTLWSGVLNHFEAIGGREERDASAGERNQIKIKRQRDASARRASTDGRRRGGEAAAEARGAAGGGAGKEDGGKGSAQIENRDQAEEGRQLDA